MLGRVKMDSILRLNVGQNMSVTYTEFILFPFPGVTSHRQILALPFLSVYGLIVGLNFIVCYTVWRESSLHTPMYVLIALLLTLNIIGTTSVMPKMIQSLLGQNLISLSGCLSQMFFVYSSTMFKSVVLLLMALDRYVAICRPLRYHNLMNRTSLLQLWMVGVVRNCSLVLVLVFLTAKVRYCKSNYIPNFICQYVALISLACGDVSKIQMVGLVVRIGVTILDITILLICYAKVLTNALKIAVGSARHKALNTCANHLSVALLVYACGLLSSLLTKLEESISYDIQNLSSVIYFLFPAVANPIIYGFRVTEIRDRLMKPFKKKVGVNLNLFVKTATTDTFRRTVKVDDQILTFSHTTFILFGFPEFTESRALLLIPFLIVYVAILLGNLLIIYRIWVEKSLQSPMYALIALLFFVNISCTNTVMPPFLLSLAFTEYRISLGSCLGQMFFIYLSVASESTVILLMALDRYAAICRPLHYHTLMTRPHLGQLVLLCLVRNIILVCPVIISVSSVRFCDSNVIHSFACENMVLLNLGCGDISRMHLIGLVIRIIISALDGSIFVISYLYILHSAMKITKGEALKKALHTCSTHLIVVILIYICGFSSSIVYRMGETIPIYTQNLVSAIYFLFPATVNPFIYGIRVTEIRICLVRAYGRKKVNGGVPKSCQNHVKISAVSTHNVKNPCASRKTRG
ncbi:uncharacterized protein PAF06_004111 [Gastrophryne carolinensis]